MACVLLGLGRAFVAEIMENILMEIKTIVRCITEKFWPKKKSVMSKQRYRELSMSPDLKLTQEELDDGWFFLLRMGRYAYPKNLDGSIVLHVLARGSTTEAARHERHRRGVILMKLFLTIVGFTLLIVIALSLIFKDESERQCEYALEYIKAMNYCLDYDDKCKVGPDEIVKYAQYQNYVRAYCGRPR